MPTDPSYTPAADIARDREHLISRFIATRSQSEQIAGRLSVEDQQVQSMPDVSPTKWHLAHVTWFFETFVLKPHAPGYDEFDPAFGYLFNSYYETLGPRHARPDRGLLTRPSNDEVMAYRAHVDQAVRAFMLTSDDETFAAAADLLELGIHHEQQHQELALMDIKHVLSCNPLAPAYRKKEPVSVRETHTLGWFEIEGGTYEIGHQGGGFAFDNEGPAHQ